MRKRGEQYQFEKENFVPRGHLLNISLLQRVLQSFRSKAIIDRCISKNTSLQNMKKLVYRLYKMSLIGTKSSHFNTRKEQPLLQ